MGGQLLASGRCLCLKCSCGRKTSSRGGTHEEGAFIGTTSLGPIDPLRDLGAVGREGMQAPAVVASGAEDPSLFQGRGDSSRSQGSGVGGRAEPDYVHLGKIPLGILLMRKQMISSHPPRIFIPACPPDWRSRPGRKHFTVFPPLSH